LAAKLMESMSPWVPIMIPFFILTPLTYLITLLLPETLPRTTGGPGTSKHARPSSPFRSKPFAAALRAHLADAWARLRESVAMLRGRSVQLLLATFLLQNAIQIAQNQILAQSISTRFGWTLAQVGYLMSVRGAVTILVLALLPAASWALASRRVLGRRALPPFARDMALARASAAVLAAGCLLCAMPGVGAVLGGVGVSTLAVGLGSMTKSLIACFVAAEHTTRLYTLTGMVETLGGLFAGPTLAWSFQAGLKMGGGWVGLPFYYVAGLSALVFLALLFVRSPEERKVGSEENGEESSREE
jgi:MFS transporter, PCFT/HCP family, solute carrier family 46 (folate transporter), member 1